MYHSPTHPKNLLVFTNVKALNTMASKYPQHLKSITTTFVDEPPSCLEFCDAESNHFIVGTYLLTETKDDSGNIHQKKTGSVQLWSLDRNVYSLYESHPELN